MRVLNHSIVLPCPIMQELAKDTIYISQGDIPIYGGDCEYQWGFAWHPSLPHSLINQYDPQLTCIEDSMQIY